MTDLLHSTITTLAHAEEYAASNAPYSLPNFLTYFEGVKTFLKIFKEMKPDPYMTYMVNRGGYYESSDAAYGGLDVLWAFWYSRRRATPIAINSARVQQEYIALCEEHRCRRSDSEIA